MGRLNNHAADNVDVEVYPSYFPFECPPYSIPDQGNNPTKSIDDYKMNQLLELFHLENDDDFLDVGIKMLQAWLVVTPYKQIIQSQLCCFINMEEPMLELQIYVAFSKFLPTQSNVYLANGNMGYVQLIGIILLFL